MALVLALFPGLWRFPESTLASAKALTLNHFSLSTDGVLVILMLQMSSKAIVCVAYSDMLA